MVQVYLVKRYRLLAPGIVACLEDPVQVVVKDRNNASLIIRHRLIVAERGGMCISFLSGIAVPYYYNIVIKEIVFGKEANV